MGVFVAGTTLSMFAAFERTSISLALVVFYTFPILVALAAVPVYGEGLGARRVAAIGLASLGLLMLLTPSGTAPESLSNGLGHDALGVAFALVAAGCQVGYALVGSRGFASVPAFQSATLIRAFSLLCYACLVVPVLLLLGGGEGLVTTIGAVDGWAIVLVAGVIAAALPTALGVAGYRRVGPTRGAVLMLVEPLTGVLLAMLLLSERPTALQLTGAVLVLSGAALAQATPAAGARAGSVASAE
jgi:drug/metabolite transporter (DMT)-like permease